MKPIPTIQKVMTILPHTIGHDMPIAVASELMTQYGIRHLPVLKGGVLVGIISDRDLRFANQHANESAIRVEDVMLPDPYTVPPEAQLDRVVSEMAEHKYGSAIVVRDNGKVIGIFTAIDALRVLAKMLAQA